MMFFKMRFLNKLRFFFDFFDFFDNFDVDDGEDDSEYSIVVICCSLIS